MTTFTYLNYVQSNSKIVISIPKDSKGTAKIRGKKKILRLNCTNCANLTNCAIFLVLEGR